MLYQVALESGTGQQFPGALDEAVPHLPLYFTSRIAAGILLYFWVLLARGGIAECFTNRSKLFRYEVMFKNGHTTPCSHLQNFCATGDSASLTVKVILTVVS